jgi:hypothetical protein
LVADILEHRHIVRDFGNKPILLTDSLCDLVEDNGFSHPPLPGEKRRPPFITRAFVKAAGEIINEFFPAYDSRRVFPKEGWNEFIYFYYPLLIFIILYYLLIIVLDIVIVNITH